MKAKKTNRANLEQKKTMFFEYGLILALAIVLVAFESGSTKNEPKTVRMNEAIKIETDLTPITVAMPPPPPPPPVFSPIFEIVDHEAVIDEPVLIFTVETGIDDFLPIFPFEKEEEEVEIITCTVGMSHPPKFQGEDINAFQAYVQRHLSYNDEAIRLRLEGRIIARFIIDEKGNLVQPEILRGVDSLLDNEVIRVLKNSPKWKPGKQNTIPVKVQFVIPVIFKLQ